MSISPARQAAFDILLRIETENAYSSILLARAADKLSPRDRSLCHEITLGTLRRQIFLDSLIDGFSKNKKLDTEVRIACRLGLYQIRDLDKIPAYSAINDSVNIVKRVGKSSAKGFVNALLRRAADLAVPYTADVAERISVETSHPKWLIEKWAHDFGIEDASRLAEANNRMPAIAFRRTAGSTEAANPAFAKASTSRFVEGCWLTSAIDPELFALAESGEIYFQDEASQIVASAVGVESASSYLDVCASPGSKATMIASNSKQNNRNLLTVAGDLHNSRIEILISNCQRQKADSVLIVQYDAEVELPFAERVFDRVLVDPPCSGTGTIRHNPEIRYRVSADDFAELAAKQLNILKNASKALRAGGILIYSTCSLEKEENEAVCASFIESVKGFVKITPKIHESLLTVNGYGRTFPQRDEMDGFFIAAFERK